MESCPPSALRRLALSDAYSVAAKDIRVRHFSGKWCCGTFHSLPTSVRHDLEQDPSGDLSEELFLNLVSFSLRERDAQQTTKGRGRMGQVRRIFVGLQHRRDLHARGRIDVVERIGIVGKRGTHREI